MSERDQSPIRHHRSSCPFCAYEPPSEEAWETHVEVCRNQDGDRSHDFSEPIWPLFYAFAIGVAIIYALSFLGVI